MNALNALKARTIRAEIVRRGAADVAALESFVSAQTTVDDLGEIVAVEPNGTLTVGSGPGATKTLSHVLDELERTKPALFGAKAAPKAAVITDPAKPGFNLSKALIAARNDPALHAELMDRLAPKPMRVL